MCDLYTFCAMFLRGKISKISDSANIKAKLEKRRTRFYQNHVLTAIFCESQPCHCPVFAWMSPFKEGADYSIRGYVPPVTNHADVKISSIVMLTKRAAVFQHYVQ